VDVSAAFQNFHEAMNDWANTVLRQNIFADILPIYETENADIKMNTCNTAYCAETYDTI